MFNYSLDSQNYTWKNALFWGNFVGHCKKVTKGNLNTRLVHLIIALVEFIPILGQVASIFEKCMMTGFTSQSSNPTSSLLLSQKKIYKVSFSESILALNQSEGRTDQINEVEIKVINKINQSLASSIKKREQKRIAAAVKIQSLYRMHRACLTLEKLKNERLKEQKFAAAIKIQSAWRGFLARKEAKKAKRHFLSYQLLEKAKYYIDVPSPYYQLPRACNGKTPVYLPSDLPIVLKHSGSPDNQKRLDQMKQGREIVELNNYQRLIIPRARVYANFIIESRLPIRMHGTKQQMSLYAENRDRFAQAVEEFTGFLCQSNFYDITGGSHDPYNTLAKTPVGRYDNIALYLEEDQGRIGLIDLERFSPINNRWGKNGYYFKCRDAIHLFPYHLEEILRAAKKFDPSIEKYRQELIKHRDESLKRLKIVYEDHLDFIKSRNITFENPAENLKIDPVQQELVAGSVSNFIQENNEIKWDIDDLSNRPEEIISLFKKEFPGILDDIYGFLSNLLNDKKNTLEQPISCYNQLLAFRTLRFSYTSDDYQELMKNVSAKLEMIKIENELNKESFVATIIRRTFKELASKKQIAYYNPNFGYGSYGTYCVFC